MLSKNENHRQPTARIPVLPWQIVATGTGGDAGDRMPNAPAAVYRLISALGDLRLSIVALAAKGKRAGRTRRAASEKA